LFTSRYPGYNIVKRGMDVAGALFLLLAFGLPMLALMAIIACDGGRPLFAHPRVGRNGRPFRCWKFRTMRPDAAERLSEVLADPQRAAEWARTFKLAQDPRVTLIGHFLRRTSLDELPQLWNVLLGEMSLVGPRPVTAEELPMYGPVAPLLCSVLPGITGPWQISGRNGTTYAERVEIDRRYVLGRSILGDVRVLLMTPSVLVRATGR
jgi:lipopolysaccharide/colanic/teichoic acid biosynthesis glycosyltransferase